VREESQWPTTINKRPPSTPVTASSPVALVPSVPCPLAVGATINNNNNDSHNLNKHNSSDLSSSNIVDSYLTINRTLLSATESVEPSGFKSTVEFSATIRGANGREIVLSEATPVKKILLEWASAKSFSIGGLKRSIHTLWKERQSSGEPEVPNHLSARDMFDERLFRCGDVPVESPLQPEVMASFHRTICRSCRAHGDIDPGCYFRRMLDCIIYGWNPPIHRPDIKPRANLKNSKNASVYSVQMKKEFQMMQDHGVVELAREDQVICINPMGAVVKNSDKQRAKTLVHVNVVDSDSLQEASDRLVAIGQPKIKCRISTDCTGSGLNGASNSPRFAYSSISQALRLVEREGYMGKGDISRYFYSFPLAEKAKELFGFRLFGSTWRFRRLPFGLTNCPYYCSTWTAEFCQWLEAMGIPTAFMVDDVFLARLTEAAARSDLEAAAGMFEAIGLSMEKSKFGLGQSLTFIGILIDSVTMTLRMDPLSAGGFVLQLLEYKTVMQSTPGTGAKSLELSDVRHMAGKLNWFSEVIQSGRLHLGAIWSYMQSHPSLTSQRRADVLSEISWWIGVLTLWADETDAEGQFPIVSGAELLDRPHTVQLCQSDASGTDGFGYVSSYLNQDDFDWKSFRWLAGKVPTQSHQAELQALHTFVLQGDHKDICLIIWITDSESGCYSVNRANCRDPLALPLLKDIYLECDRLGCQLLAVWVPRENNQLADHLSHLSYILCRDSVGGRESSFRTGRSVGTNSNDQTPKVN
jgi:hypothetical protein